MFSLAVQMKGSTKIDKRDELQRYLAEKVVPAENLDEIGSLGWWKVCMPIAKINIVVQTNLKLRIVQFRFMLTCTHTCPEWRKISSPSPGPESLVNDFFPKVQRSLLIADKD